MDVWESSEGSPAAAREHARHFATVSRCTAGSDERPIESGRMANNTRPGRGLVVA